MALDFICRETNQHLYEIDDKGFSYLDVIFQNFYYRTGQRITPYDDIILDKNIQKYSFTSLILTKNQILK